MKTKERNILILRGVFGEASRLVSERRGREAKLLARSEPQLVSTPVRWSFSVARCTYIFSSPRSLVSPTANGQRELSADEETENQCEPHPRVLLPLKLKIRSACLLISMRSSRWKREPSRVLDETSPPIAENEFRPLRGVEVLALSSKFVSFP